MRYQSPISNPLSQYWEEEFVFGSPNKLWKDFLTRLKYLGGEYIIANVILTYSVCSNALTIKPLLNSISLLYRIYGFKWGIKRAIDIVGTFIGIILLLPVFAIVSIAIKLDSPGPVFFRQGRIGKNRRRTSRRIMSISGIQDQRSEDRRKTPRFGKPFIIFKFRTMHRDAEKHTGPVWASKNDPRITRVGAFLRATRIDEFPQLFNILKGEMSVVGPRPEREFFITALRNNIDSYDDRLLVRPGLTGLAQVNHKYDESETDTKVKVGYDLDYIKKLTILNDLKIIIKTVFVVFAAKGM